MKLQGRNTTRWIAVIRKYEQLWETNMIQANNLSKQVVLELLMLIKKKQRRQCINKHEVSSPTIELDNIIATMSIDVKENRGTWLWPMRQGVI